MLQLLRNDIHNVNNFISDDDKNKKQKVMLRLQRLQTTKSTTDDDDRYNCYYFIHCMHFNNVYNSVAS